MHQAGKSSLLLLEHSLPLSGFRRTRGEIYKIFWYSCSTAMWCSKAILHQKSTISVSGVGLWGDWGLVKETVGGDVIKDQA